MADIAFVAIALAFFGLAYLYVLGCDRIIGRDAPSAGADADRGAQVTDRTEEVPVVSWENVLALIVAVPVAAYLVVALLFPERF